MPGPRADSFRADLALRPLTAEDAESILGWRYPGELAGYSFDTPDPVARAEELRDLLDPRNAYHAVLTGAGELVGFCCFGPDARVPGGDYREPALDVGLGLRPDLVGQGLGGAFLAAILDHAGRELAPPLFRLTVAAHNKRAIRVYERAGFATSGRFARAGSDEPGAEFLIMVRQVDERPR